MRVSIAALLLAIIGCSRSTTLPPGGKSTTFAMEAKNVERIEVDNQPGFAEPGLPVRSTDPEAIRNFLSSIGKAQKTEEHKCASVLQVSIVRKSGDNLRILLLPGHDDHYYEFRKLGEGIYRVPREPFIAALTKLGVKHVPMSPSEVIAAPPRTNQPDDF